MQPIVQSVSSLGVAGVPLDAKLQSPRGALGDILSDDVGGNRGTSGWHDGYVACFTGLDAQ